MQEPTLRQLRTLAAVARHRTFTGAARELGVTQPAVSMQMRELEAACGVPLFEKLGRRLHLTDAGEEVARLAGRVAEGLEQTRERLDALRGLRRGRLKLGALSTAKYFAPSLLAAFQRDHPQVTIRFSVGNREEMTRRLAENEIDLVIMGRPPRGLDTVAEAFSQHPLAMVAAPSHPLAARRGIPLAELAGESFLIREPGSGTRASMEQLFAEHGLRYEASLEAGSNETLKQAVIAGMGISLLSLHTVGLELAAGRLRVLDVKGLPILREWYVIHLAGKRLSPVAEAFRAFLLQKGSRLLRAAVDPRSGR